MKNFGNKLDNDETSAGVVVANEYNSIFNEAKGAVTPFLELNELDNQQLGKAIDIASKAMFYNDIGSPNAVHLTRGATAEQIETLFDGMVVMFSPSNANTGASTLKVNGLGAKAMKFNDSALVAGMLILGVKYIAVYKLSDDSFHIDILSGDSIYYRRSEIDSLVSEASVVGSILTMPVNVIPSGYLECNGAAISRSSFSDLFGVVGTTFGAGDGSATFNVPDWRGEFLRGWDNGRGIDSGRGIATFQGDVFKAHSHSGALNNAASSPQYGLVGGSTYHVGTTGVQGTGATGSTETRPRNWSVMYCIKF